jgi:parallel beta helix pectate lyase-like protein
MRPPVFKHVILILALLGIAAPAAAQKAINQAKANAGGVTPGDAPGFPVTISTPGSYQLTGNLTVNDANTHAIHITADHVTLDLNGFRITGPGTAGNGFGVFTDTADNVTVVDGTVTKFGGGGVFLLGHSARVENVRAVENGFRGIFVGTNSVIAGCIAIGNGNTGLTITSGTVTGNTSESNGAYGISASSATVVNNSVTGNASHGMWLANSGYAHNVLSENNGGGAQVTGGIQMGAGSNICNGAPCP